MAIYKDRDKWRAEIYYKGKKLKSKIFENKLMAQRWEREQKNELDKFKATGIKFEDPTYKDLFDSWLTAAEMRKQAGSLVKDIQMNRDYIEPIIGDLKISEITTAHFDKIVNLGKKA